MALQYQRDGGFANETQSVQYQSDGVFVNAPATSVSGTGSLTSSAAVLSGTGTEVFSAIAAFAASAASLDISGELAYNGTAAWVSTAASIAGTGTTGTGTQITGVGALTSAPASLRAKGRRRLKAGHDLVDLGRYNAFVEQAEPILEELGQVPAPTGATAPVIDPVPLAEPVDALRPPSRTTSLVEAVADALLAATLPAPQAPTLVVTGKRWIKGTAGLATQPPMVVAHGIMALQAKGYMGATAPSALRARATVDNYYTIRQKDEQFIEEFLVHQILSGATSDS